MWACYACVGSCYHVVFKARALIQLSSNSKSGELRAEKSEGLYWLDFPFQSPKQVTMPKLLPEAIGTIPIFTGYNVDLLVLVESEQIVHNMTPNFRNHQKF